MVSSPLDRILTRASGASTEVYADVLALVNIAKAAEDLEAECGPQGPTEEAVARLRKALAALNKADT